MWNNVDVDIDIDLTHNLIQLSQTMYKHSEYHPIYILYNFKMGQRLLLKYENNLEVEIVFRKILYYLNISTKHFLIYTIQIISS